MLCEFHLNKTIYKPQQKPSPLPIQLRKTPRKNNKDKDGSREEKINN